MKKSLLAVAAIGAFASAAQAQSSVTVYGILDVGYVGSHVRDTSGTYEQTQANGFTGTGAEQTSRLGFRGNEDLGGGKYAFFLVESALDVNSTPIIGTNRLGYAGIGAKGLGAASIGKQYTPVFNANAMSDPGKANGTVGNVIYVANNNSTTSAANTYTIATVAFTNTVTNAVVFKSDDFKGFKAEAMYSQTNKDQSQVSATSGGTTNNTAWGLGANYTWNKLLVNAAYQQIVNVTDSLTTATAIGFGGTALVNTTDAQSYVGATYDFGILKAYAQWSNRKASSKISSTFAKRQAQQIGVRAYITPVIESWASVGNGRYAAYGASQPTINFTGYQLGSNYYLSKRTNLYAIFGSMQSSGSNVVTGGGSSVNQYALGVRHTF
jgi:predicted porin